MDNTEQIMIIPPSPEQNAVQYDRGLTLIDYYVQLSWLVFGAFLLTETMLLAGIASVAKDGPCLWVFGGSLLGFVLAFPWWTSFRYNHALYLLRVTEARKCEPSAGNFFTNGHELIKGKWFLDPSGRKVRIPRLARLLPPSRR